MAGTSTAALQAQIDDTVGMMRENISKVSQRGERFDGLQNKTDSLSASAQGFRLGAGRARRRMNPWTRVYDDVAGGLSNLGSAGFKKIQEVSGSIYEAGSALLSALQENVIETEIQSPRISVTDDPSAFGIGGEEEYVEQNIVEKLVADWTTLPVLPQPLQEEETAHSDNTEFVKDNAEGSKPSEREHEPSGRQIGETEP